MLNTTYSSPKLMGILNVTPDSFSDGGCFMSPADAIGHGLHLINEGAAIIDIGGESTRPNSTVIAPDEEQARILPVIKGLKAAASLNNIRLSVDTRNGSTMREALKLGADIINDISALTHDPESIHVAADSQAEIVLMHMQGTPQTMQHNPTYANVVSEVCDYLEQRIAACVHAGIHESRIIIDPGLGFGKTVEHNVALLANIPALKKLGVRVLIGASRKSFLAKLAGLSQGCSRLPVSLASALAAAQAGADILRVHDVAETKEALTVWQALGRIDNAL